MNTEQINSKQQNFHLGLWIYSISFALIVIAQTAHYVTYFEQPLFRSTIWAIVDWSIWFFVIFLLVQNRSLRSLITNPSFKSVYLIPCILILPFLHGLLTQLVYSVFFEPTVSFFDDVSRYLDKKWLQSSFTVILLMLGFNFVQKITSISVSAHSGADELNWILIKDGKISIRLRPEEVKWITVVKNYVIINTTQKELVVRSSLKSIYRLFEPHRFVMVSRSVIVNVDIVRAIEKISKYRHEIHLESGKRFSIGRTFLKSVRKSMERYSRTNI